jgi:His-Xaa-Ser system protein HxsD
MPEVSIIVDARVYRLSAVKKAAYRMADRCFVRIEAESAGRIEVRLAPKTEQIPCETLEGMFRNELLDQDLRETIAEETERVRNLILAQAFSGVSVIDGVSDSADYRDDPLSIAQSQVTKS